MNEGVTIGGLWLGKKVAMDATGAFGEAVAFLIIFNRFQTLGNLVIVTPADGDS